MVDPIGIRGILVKFVLSNGPRVLPYITKLQRRSKKAHLYYCIDNTSGRTPNTSDKTMSVNILLDVDT